MYVYIQPPPFLQLIGTDLPGRFCAPIPSLKGPIDCCLPCPVTDWVYSDGMYNEEYGTLISDKWPEFKVIPEAANWLNVAGIACSISLLVSYMVLPAKQTSRHYLNVGHVTAISLMQVCTGWTALRLLAN